MKLISVPALVVALIYGLIVVTILVHATGAEEITYTWLLFGFSGIYFIHGWGAVVFNGVCLYALVAYLIPALARSYRKYSRQPE